MMVMMMKAVIEMPTTIQIALSGQERENGEQKTRKEDGSTRFVLRSKFLTRETAIQLAYQTVGIRLLNRASLGN